MSTEKIKVTPPGEDATRLHQEVTPDYFNERGEIDLNKLIMSFPETEPVQQVDGPPVIPELVIRTRRKRSRA